MEHVHQPKETETIIRVFVLNSTWAEFAKKDSLALLPQAQQSLQNQQQVQLLLRLLRLHLCQQLIY